jgi:hypothetical protein
MSAEAPRLGFAPRARSLRGPRACASLLCFLGFLSGCGAMVSPDADGPRDGSARGDGGREATTGDGSAGSEGNPDAGIDPERVGTLPSSCGHSSVGVPPVDCTARGDRQAVCVFGHHCGCSAGFVCTVPYSPEQRCTGESLCECAAGAVCVPR